MKGKPFYGRKSACLSVRAPIIQHMPETKCISEPDTVTVHEGAVRAAGGEQTNRQSYGECRLQMAMCSKADVRRL